jgi:hypothetical protein
MAMEKPNSWIIGYKSEAEVSIRLDDNGISSNRGVGGPVIIPNRPVKQTAIIVRAGYHLEIVTV